MAPPRRAPRLPHKRAVLRFGLAHHPTCSVFAGDLVVARLGRFRTPVCIGCATFWPTFLVAVPLLFLLASRAAVPWWAFLGGGVVLSAVQTFSYMRLARRRPARIAVKMVLAVGVASVACALVLAPAPAAVRVGVGLVLFAGYGALQTLRVRNIFATCDACPWRRDWQRCPGFVPFTDHKPGTAPAGWNGGAELPHAWPWPRT